MSIIHLNLYLVIAIAVCLSWPSCMRWDLWREWGLAASKNSCYGLKNSIGKPRTEKKGALAKKVKNARIFLNRGYWIISKKNIILGTEIPRI